MTDSKPLVSIGMPVYNGEKYIREALDSVLAQDYEHFELIISDNASTDGTAEICQEYAARDTRVRYSRNATNIGAVNNFNRAFKFARGDYFAWLADDDAWEPTFLTQCLNAFAGHPWAVLCFPVVQLIDENGQPVEIYHENLETTGLTTPHRLHLVLMRAKRCSPFYGLIRSSALKRIRRSANTHGHDLVVLAELSLWGEFVRVPEVLFNYRIYHQKTLEDVWKRLPAPGSYRRTHYTYSRLARTVVSAVAWPNKPLVLRLWLILEAMFCLNRRFGPIIRSEVRHMLRAKWQDLAVWLKRSQIT